MGADPYQGGKRVTALIPETCPALTLAEHPTLFIYVPNYVLKTLPNQLTNLPPEIELLTKLEELHIHNNQLAELPSQITKWYIFMRSANFPGYMGSDSRGTSIRTFFLWRSSSIIISFVNLNIERKYKR